MDRRSFLTALAASVAGAAGVAAAGGCSPVGHSQPQPVGPETPEAVLPPPPAGPPPVRRFPVPGGVVTVLPGDEPTLLLGIDDGVSTQAVLDYCTLVKDADLRLVFFGNGCYDSWSDAKPVLAPLVESGQVQIGNHTLTHPKLPTLSDSQIVHQLTENAKVFRNIYGIDVAPWYRPPYGMRTDHTDAVAAGIGYNPPVNWVDSFVDWGPTSTDYYKEVAARCFQPRAVVLGHANKPDVKPAYSAFVDLIHSRGLRTVTLDDVFLPRGDAQPTAAGALQATPR